MGRLWIVLPLLAALVACKTTNEPVEPRVVIQVQKEQVPVPCPALGLLGPEPAYPDTPEAIDKAETPGALAGLYVQGRWLRIQRLAEYEAAKTACLF